MMSFCPEDASRFTMNGSSCGILPLRVRARSAGWIDIGQGFDGVPIHQRQIVIVAVLGVGEQGGGVVPAVYRRESLQDRSDGEADNL